jgi:integrase
VRAVKSVEVIVRINDLWKSVLNKAKELALWDKPNPTEGIKKFRENSRDRFLQPNQLLRFFKALSEEPNENFRDCFIVALLTGARRANVQAMKWEEINLESREWRIPDTKNKTPHTITLTDEVIIVLQRRKTSSTSPHVSPHIFIKK